MALIDKEITGLAREFAERAFVRANATATLNLDDLKAIIQRIDTAMNATTTQVQSAAPGVVLKLAIRDYVRQAVPGLTDQQAGLGLALWAMHAVGLI